jgi:hypothetical protein
VFSDVLLFQLVRYKNKQKSVILRFEKKGSLTLRVQGGISDYLTIAAIWLFFSISRAVCQFEGTNGHPHNEGSSSSCTAPIQQWSIRFFFSISRAVCQFKGTNGHPQRRVIIILQAPLLAVLLIMMNEVTPRPTRAFLSTVGLAPVAFVNCSRIPMTTC